jgi:hypothetical protein
MMHATLVAPLARAAVKVDDVASSYGSLIFMGCFFLALLLVLIWWLRRG